MDEMAPQQMDIGRSSNPRNDNEDKQVYYKNDDVNTSIRSDGTYGQKI